MSLIVKLMNGGWATTLAMIGICALNQFTLFGGHDGIHPLGIYFEERDPNPGVW